MVSRIDNNYVFKMREILSVGYLEILKKLYLKWFEYESVSCEDFALIIRSGNDISMLKTSFVFKPKYIFWCIVFKFHRYHEFVCHEKNKIHTQDI